MTIETTDNTFKRYKNTCGWMWMYLVNTVRSALFQGIKIWKVCNLTT